MEMALFQAQSAAEAGEVPVGAVVADGKGNVLSYARNERETLRDPTAHAEVLAIRRAAEKSGGWRLSGAVLYVTLEPCIMCVGAVVNSRIETVVFGAYDTGRGALESNCGTGFDGGGIRRVAHRGGVMETECAGLIRRFFGDLRGKSAEYRRAGSTER